MSSKKHIQPNRGTSDAWSPLFTRHMLASRWQCSIETLKRAERARKLPFLKIGRGVRYRREVIEQIEKQAEVS